MTIALGDKLPEIVVNVCGSEGPRAVSTANLFARKKVVVFSVPGAFTPTCSARHLPGFVDKVDQFRSKGVSLIVCVSVNDIFVMEAWAKKSNVAEAVLMLADGNGDFVRSLGLEVDQSAHGMGTRARRSAIIVEDGVVSALFIEPAGSFGISCAESVLENL